MISKWRKRKRIAAMKISSKDRKRSVIEQNVGDIVTELWASLRGTLFLGTLPIQMTEQIVVRLER